MSCAETANISDEVKQYQRMNTFYWRQRVDLWRHYWQVYVNIVRDNLARQAKKEQAASALVDDETVQVSRYC